MTGVIRPDFIESMITALFAMFTAMGGFWTYFRNRLNISDANREQMIILLMGLAHERIMNLGLSYIERGWISSEEYEDLRRYLVEPYLAVGGNGTAKRIMHAVERLPFRQQPALAIPIRRGDIHGGIHQEEFEGEDRRRDDHERHQQQYLEYPSSE